MRVFTRLLGLTAAALALTAAPALAQSAAELFDQNTVQEIRLSVNSRDLRTLRANTHLNTYYVADLTWKNVKVRNVGIRSRGQGSRNPQKPGFRVDMAHYTTGQTFVGLSTIILDNIWQDDALIREKLSFTLFERMGLPAPRESYCKLFINNEYQGLYAITEEIDANFVQRTLGQTGGTVFEFHHQSARQFRAEDLGSIEAYKPYFEPRTRVLDADTTLYTPIVNFFKEVNAPDDAVWRSRVEEYVDLHAFARYVAVETFLVDNDAILGFAGMNNFYLYREPNSTKHRFFVWDKDQAFQFRADLAPVQVTDANVLFRRAMGYSDVRETYLAALEECARIAASEDFMLPELERVVALIADAVRTDTKKQWDNERWDLAVQFMREFAAQRSSFVLAEVARIRRGG